MLRLGHRIRRDKRATTHLFLAARALGADGAYYTGDRDEMIEKSISRVNEVWGGSFRVEYVRDWKRVLKLWKDAEGESIHLTMYGIPLQEKIGEIRASSRDKLIIVGGPKVPSEVFKIADWNISVTSQPHSEISALSIFLHELLEGKELQMEFENAKVRIIPQIRGKKIAKMEKISGQDDRLI